MPPYRICCLTDYATLNYCLPEYVALLKTITFSPSVDGSSDNSSLPMSGKVARGARRMRRAINRFPLAEIYLIPAKRDITFCDSKIYHTPQAYITSRKRYPAFSSTSY